MKLEFSWKVLKKHPLYNFTKIRPMEIEFFHTDRRIDWRTDMTMLIATDSTFKMQTFQAVYPQQQ